MLLTLKAIQFPNHERTLSRRCQQELGMSFSEWRQRLHFLHAIMKLEQGNSVHQVAFDVGYILNKLQDARQDRERGLLFVSSAG